MYGYMSRNSRTPITITENTQLEEILEVENLIFAETKNTKNEQLVNYLKEPQQIEKTIQYALKIINIKDDPQAYNKIPQTIIDSTTKDFTDYLKGTRGSSSSDSSEEEEEEETKTEQEKDIENELNNQRDEMVKEDLIQKIEQKYPTIATNLICSHLGKRVMQPYMYAKDEKDSIKKIIIDIFRSVEEEGKEITIPTMNNLLRITIKSNEGYRDEMVQYYYENWDVMKSMLKNAQKIPSIDELIGTLIVHQFDKKVDDYYIETKREKMSEEKEEEINAKRAELIKYMLTEAFFESEENSQAIVRISEYIMKYADSDYPTDAYVSAISRFRSEAMMEKKEVAPTENYLVPHVEEFQTKLFKVENDMIFKNGIDLLQTIYMLKRHKKLLGLTFEEDSDSEEILTPNEQETLAKFIVSQKEQLISILKTKPEEIVKRETHQGRVGAKRLALINFLHILNHTKYLSIDILRVLYDLFWEYPNNSIMQFYIMRITIHILHTQEEDEIIEMLKGINLVNAFIKKVTPLNGEYHHMGQLGHILNITYALNDVMLKMEKVAKFVEEHENFAAFFEFMNKRKYLEQIYKLDTQLPSSQVNNNEDDEFDYDDEFDSPDSDLVTPDEVTEQHQQSMEKLEEQDSVQASPVPEDEISPDTQKLVSEQTPHSFETSSNVTASQDTSTPSPQSDASANITSTTTTSTENNTEDTYETDSNTSTKVSPIGTQTLEGLRPHTPATPTLVDASKKNKNKKKKKSKLAPIKKQRDLGFTPDESL